MKRILKSYRYASSGKVHLPFLAWALFPAFATAQYRAVVLQPDGYAFSVGRASDQGYQAGFAGTLDQRFNHAIIWNGSAQNYVDLNPAGYNDSFIDGAGGGQQVGGGKRPGLSPNAVLWTGSAASAVDLDPGNVMFSEALACDGVQQVGYTGDDRFNYAALWSGTAASYVNLTPAGARESVAQSLSHGRQSGAAKFSLKWHAGVWSGSDSSFVDIHPRGFDISYVDGMSETQLVGVAAHPDQVRHAMLWRSATEVPIDLTPTGYTDTEAHATNGTFQAGQGLRIGGNGHALLWHGSASDYIDLHRFLPPYLTSSRAFAINGDGVIVGKAYLHSGAYAVAWIPVPEPSPAFVLTIPLLALVARRWWLQKGCYAVGQNDVGRVCSCYVGD